MNRCSILFIHIRISMVIHCHDDLWHTTSRLSCFTSKWNLSDVMLKRPYIGSCFVGIRRYSSLESGQPLFTLHGAHRGSLDGICFFLLNENPWEHSDDTLGSRGNYFAKLWSKPGCHFCCVFFKRLGRLHWCEDGWTFFSPFISHLSPFFVLHLVWLRMGTHARRTPNYSFSSPNKCLSW